MKDLSFLGLHNSLGLKMNKGLKNLCTGDTSTSTLKQQQRSPEKERQQATLEEMIRRLDLEEKMATRAKLLLQQKQECGVQHRMSCVNSSDILRSARNALNQYPRFSLDGKDAMYRSSFRNRASVVVRDGCLPAKVAGERVLWCKPGVVGRLMGLDAMPLPVRLNRSRILRNHTKLDNNHHHHRVASCSRATATGYSIVKPVVAVEMARDEAMRRFL